MTSSSSVGSRSFSPLGSTRGESAGILPYHSMSTLLHLGNSTNSEGLGIECLQPSLNILGKLCVSPSKISSSSSVQVSGRTCQRSTLNLILVSLYWMEAPWLPTVLDMLADISQWCPIIKDLVMDVSVGHVLKGLSCLHVTLWLLNNVCYTNRGSLPQSVRQGIGATQASISKVYQQHWKEQEGWCAQEGEP